MEIGKKSNSLTGHVQTHPNKAVYIYTFSNKVAAYISDLKLRQWMLVLNITKIEAAMQSFRSKFKFQSSRQETGRER